MSERYHPCDTGLHVCGIDDKAEEFFTERNFPIAGAAAARVAFERARTECAAGADEPDDFVVDLVIAGETYEDFFISRQMLNRLEILLP